MKLNRTTSMYHNKNQKFTCGVGAGAGAGGEEGVELGELAKSQESLFETFLLPWQA